MFVERPFLLNTTDSENNNSFVIVVIFSYTVIRDICLYSIYSIKCCILSFLTNSKKLFVILHWLLLYIYTLKQLSDLYPSWIEFRFEISIDSESIIQSYFKIYLYITWFVIVIINLFIFSILVYIFLCTKELFWIFKTLYW